ncbi:hypothetical protein QVD17_02665 [Tagetes erecta]|uniref:TIR domain-containing protein n=1 Tax=Tagetes erecta TaxID=13708 RepID=A0AAD8LCX2_TARER|nr:hypothetical protein QVD17_02665 [Tagetes erecta]
MASSSSSSHPTPASSFRSCKYDVFVSFRGEDTRKTFVDHLHSTLKHHLISVYKDNETLPRGESIDQSLFEAIKESQIAVIIFSKNYVDSSWCLEELAYIMKCKVERGLIVIPIFYDVEPSECRNQKRRFEEAFAKHEAKNFTKAAIWRQALVDVSNIAGWELKNVANGFFPDTFLPQKLVVLKLDVSMQKQLWKCNQDLPHLKVLHLSYMSKLLRTPDFNRLPHLQKLTLSNCIELEEIHPSLGNHTSLEYLNVSYCDNLKRLPRVSQMKNIKTLKIMDCRLKEGQIPSGIDDLSNLQELILAGNSFSRLDFSLVQLTQLKSLNLSRCQKLLELPELPPGLAILTAHDCKSLTIVDDFSNDCKELCQVSLIDGWGEILLQAMLKENATENGSMHLCIEGLEILKGFTPLRIGSDYRLKLPENWCNDFSGFLMCTVLSKYIFFGLRTSIGIQQMNGVEFEEDMVWEESDGDSDVYMTYVWYVPFGSLRHTTWWDQTYKALEFNILDTYKKPIAFGVRLVDKESTSGRVSDTSTNSSSPYTPKFKIIHDSAFELTAELVPYNLWCV